MSRRTNITVFEHQSLKEGQEYSRIEFTEIHREALERFYGKGVSYFSLIHNGVQFNEHVGILQVGQLIIEVLPKADKNEDDEKWRRLLIGMLKSVGAFDVKAPSQSSLNLKTNFILDLYFELYIKELEHLLHKGLIKKYRKTQGNSMALKGALCFGKHIQNNLVHQERFFVKYNTYDQQHLLHQILYTALSLLKRINTNTHLQSRIGALLLNFLEMPTLKVSDATFERITYNRKNQDYRNAIEIARLLLLNYHPDVSRGQNDVLALMFDMNLLWEQFVYVSLRKRLGDTYQVKGQASKYFWKPESGSRSSIRPDILLQHVDANEKIGSIVLDTKWKNIEGRNPSPEDLRQMFIYHLYFNASKTALIYPGSGSINKGDYYETGSDRTSNLQCSVITISTAANIDEWQEKIVSMVLNLINRNSSKI